MATTRGVVEDGGAGAHAGAVATGEVVCDRCGRPLAVRTVVVTAQAEVLCRACFDAWAASPAGGRGARAN